MGFYQADGAATVAGTAGTADAMNIDIGAVGHVVVDDVADVGQVDTPGGHVGGDEEGHFTFVELADRLDALALLHFATDPGTGNTGRLQLAG